ncbi:PqqD family protein [Chitinophaga sp. Cy-1792]|uniref:PqqD family protein n=1 Tax=Chitinophaga sp. Cy-1792 TaxID=2608339 RepID=UPI00141F91F4|nr:PqqD family protein [Chitinophaga sp. Cy-1792]
MGYTDKKIHISENTIVREMGTGVVILNLNTERFYELNEIGKRFWELIAENNGYMAAVEILQNEYEVSTERLQDDLTRLIDDLSKAALVEVR